MPSYHIDTDQKYFSWKKKERKGKNVSHQNKLTIQIPKIFLARKFSYFKNFDELWNIS